jgi:hypothetical protein
VELLADDGILGRGDGDLCMLRHLDVDLSFSLKSCKSSSGALEFGSGRSRSQSVGMACDEKEVGNCRIWLSHGDSFGFELFVG